MRQLLDGIVYLLVRIFLKVVRILPCPVGYSLCKFLATCFFWIDREHRRVGMINLNIAFPHKSEDWRRLILLRSFQQLGDHLVEVSRLQYTEKSELVKRVSYEEDRGLENYLKAKKHGKGIIFLAAHISAWELLPTAHAAHGHPLNIVVRPLDNPWLEAWATGLRSRFGNRVLAKQGSIKQIFRILREGGDVGLLIDQNIQEKEGIYVPFFGRQASTSSTLAALALKTASPVVASFIYPKGPPGEYRIRFYQPIWLKESGDFEKDVRDGTIMFNRYIETVIREYPHCWLWGHRRFHTQPKGKGPY